MKKFFAAVISFFIVTNAIFADISTYNSTVITVEDVIDDFIELVNGPSYAYGIVDYEVYKEQDKQNYCFKTVTSDASYKNVKGKAITLYFVNGYLTVRTYGGPTMYNMKDCYNLNTEQGKKNMHELFNSCIDYATVKSLKWLDKYGKLNEGNFKSVSRLSLLESKQFYDAYYISSMSRDGFIWRGVPNYECFFVETINKKMLEDSSQSSYELYGKEIVYNCIHKFYGFNMFYKDEFLSSPEIDLKYARKHKDDYMPVQYRCKKYTFYISDNNYKTFYLNYEKLIKGQDLLDAKGDLFLCSNKIIFNADEKMKKYISE